MKQLFGDSPMTTILGLIGAATVVAKDLLESGETNAMNVIIAVLIAVFGRLVKDDNAQK